VVAAPLSEHDALVADVGNDVQPAAQGPHVGGKRPDLGRTGPRFLTGEELVQKRFRVIGHEFTGESRRRGRRGPGYRKAGGCGRITSWYTSSGPPGSATHAARTAVCWGSIMNSRPTCELSGPPGRSSIMPGGAGAPP
jgi:hypothetical protein